MKTKNNVQKTILSTGAVIMSLVLISFTVTAQDFWKAVITNSSFNQIALAMAETNSKPADKAPAGNNNSAAVYLSNEADEALNIEKWMTDATHFDNSTMNIEEEVENQMPVETWMFDNTKFEDVNSTEEPLVIEDWMISEKTWIR